MSELFTIHHSPFTIHLEAAAQLAEMSSAKLRRFH
jgi:hypothetical protein